MMTMMNRLDKNGKEAIRTSVSFTQEIYKFLEMKAIEKKVSIAWIVRDAVESYIRDQPVADNKEWSIENV
jgi:hypothetical protein